MVPINIEKSLSVKQITVNVGSEHQSSFDKSSPYLAF